MGVFGVDVRNWVNETNAKADNIVRAIAIEITSRIVFKSPVGNPELWAANARAVYGRETHNLFVDQINATLAPGEKKVRRLGKQKLKSMYKLRAGKDYVGGRFRANWQLTIGTAASGNIDAVDANGGKTITAAVEALQDFESGPTIFIVNNLPYGARLEYEGWSRQAPAGMVRVTVAEFNEIASNAVSQFT